MYGGATLRENYHGFTRPPHHTLGTVNDCFSDESGGSLGGLGGPSPPMFHRDLRLYSDYYAPHVASTSPFFHGTLPRHFSRDSWLTSTSSSSSPLRLPDWRETQCDYPADYGLPIPRGSLRCRPPPPQHQFDLQYYFRPEIHLAHNPLDTLHEEDSVYPDQGFDLLNQSTSSARMLPISDNSESSGRGSSSSGSARERLWTAPTSSPSSCTGAINSKKSFQNSSARESPDEGIQTDSGTDV